MQVKSTARINTAKGTASFAAGVEPAVIGREEREARA